MDEFARLLRSLLVERPDGEKQAIPNDLAERRKLLRVLMNMRPPGDLPADLLAIQDAELKCQVMEKGVIDITSIPESTLDPRLRLWRGDITRLNADAIVNPANSALLGCFQPLHNCLDNLIHSQAGIQLRNDCASIMRLQGHEEPTGHAKITSGHNLPAKHVIHTVGPIISGARPTARECRQLASCYTSCLELAEAAGLKSIAFCCISTGVFRFPHKKAAEIAVGAVLDFFRQRPARLEAVVFDVFTQLDYELYRSQLGHV